jgi:hypothetical protein
MHDCRRRIFVARRKIQLGSWWRCWRPIRHLSLGHYKIWFLLILEDLALVVRPEPAENTWTPATGPWPITKAELDETLHRRRSEIFMRIDYFRRGIGGIVYPNRFPIAHGGRENAAGNRFERFPAGHIRVFSMERLDAGRRSLAVAGRWNPGGLRARFPD